MHVSSCREQYLFNVFEVIVSTLESKLQRIENLDKAVEHLMRRVEMLDSRVTDNIHKTDSVIAKLSTLDLKLFQDDGSVRDHGTGSFGTPRATSAATTDGETLDKRLVSLDQKVSDIDNKLVGLKNQLDTNFLPADDINAEASEKKPISMNVVDITKVLNAEVMAHVSRELEGLKTATSNVDRKLQFHINLVSENLGKVLNLVSDVHEAVVEPEASPSLPPTYRNKTSVNSATAVKNSKLDTLVKHMHPILSVSEKMDEVWDVVVGTKTSVDDLVPKSDELLTQTQRQERAISDIHADLRVKANKIIANLDLVEKRLKKQENDVANLAQRPVPAELLLDPTIDRLVEYDPNRYSVVMPQDEIVTITETPAQPSTPSVTTNNHVTPTTTNFISSPSTATPVNAATTSASSRGTTRSRGVIFPSVKNKPSPANTTFTSDLINNIKDVKVSVYRVPSKTKTHYAMVHQNAYFYLFLIERRFLLLRLHRII